MKTKQYLSLPRRCRRLWQAACWLVVTHRRIARFDRLTPAQRHESLSTIAEQLLAILNVNIHINCHATCPAKPPVLAVANHISWLDSFVLMTLYPSSFIAKQSIRHWPVIGRMAERAGTVFINRRSRQNAGSVSQSIAAALAQGHSVTFFPEARTSDGLCVLPFKAALFQAALDTDTPVQAMAMRYHTPAGVRCTDAAWVGSMPFYVSLWRIVRQPQIDVLVDFAPLTGAGFTQYADRFQLKETAEHFIRHKVCQP